MYAMNQQFYLQPQMPTNNNNQIPNNVMHHNNNMKMDSKGKSRGGGGHQMAMMGGGSDKKPKGRMSAYTFFVQTCREEHRKKHPNENVNFTEFSKKCAERWKSMSDKEKKRFSDMAEKDKARYDREMATYTPPAGEGGRKRKKKDPNAPKRPLSAFFLFCGDERASVKAIYPTYGVGDVAKELGDRWNKVSPETKHKYEEKANVDKLRYEKEMGVYRGKALKPTVAAAAVEEDDDDDDDDDNE